jgi:hypothetical protein
MRNEERENEKNSCRIKFFYKNVREENSRTYSIPGIRRYGPGKRKVDLPQSSKPKVFAGARDRLSMHFPYNRSNGAFCIQKDALSICTTLLEIYL